MTLDDFEFLAWMRATAFFRDDLKRQLTELGMEESDAMAISRSDAVREANIVQLFQDYGRNSSWNPGWFLRWINHNREIYDGITEALRN